MNKQRLLLFVLVLLFGSVAYAQKALPPAPFDERDDAAAQAQFARMRLRDPETGNIPPNIRVQELDFASHLPVREQFIQSGDEQIQSTTWVPRGPYNVGGRTFAVGIDVADTNVILAGGESGGMWRSTDHGQSWARTTSLKSDPSVSALVQDTRPGKTDTWYYGTGDSLGNAIAAHSGFSSGNGIFKSTDDGQTWFAASSQTDTGKFSVPFGNVFNLVVDPASSTQDILYAAVTQGIVRSTNGGATWSMSLAAQGPLGFLPVSNSIAITPTGALYATLNNAIGGNVFRSSDGITWTDITPTGWLTNVQGIALAIAPSKPDVMYVLLASLNFTTVQEQFALWKYTYISGNGSGAGGAWEDRSANIPADYDGQNGYTMYVKVKPDDENTVFIGGVQLYRSTDGFASSANLSTIGNLIHVDQHSLAFDPADPNSMLVGNDGGLYATAEDTASDVPWASFDNGYSTTQFYSVALDHSTPGNNVLIGGMQDNGTYFTSSADAAQQWQSIDGGDGMMCLIASGRSSYYVSYQGGVTLREILDDTGNVTLSARIDPPLSLTSSEPWFTPMTLDPNNTNRMYFAALHDIWLNEDVTQIPLNTSDRETQGWTELTNTMVPSGAISAIACSTTPANIVYYGTDSGAVYRLDSANINTATPVNIGAGAGFPHGGYVNCIAVDDQNANIVIVVFSNYNVQSLFYSTNGGISWTPVGGNLEQFPDGSGAGPACFWASIVHVANGTVYLVGTSTGLYSTSSLNGMATVWSQEGATIIGNAAVYMTDARQSDGRVAVATYGNGVYSGTITSASSSVNERADVPSNVIVRNYPNPFSSTTNIEYQIPNEEQVTLKVFNTLGEEVATLVNGNVSAGEHSIPFDASSMPNGVYFYKLSAGMNTQSGKMFVVR